MADKPENNLQPYAYLEKDVGVLKTDMATVKSQVGTMGNDISGLRSEIRSETSSLRAEFRAGLQQIAETITKSKPDFLKTSMAAYTVLVGVFAVVGYFANGIIQGALVAIRELQAERIVSLKGEIEHAREDLPRMLASAREDGEYREKLIRHIADAEKRWEGIDREFTRFDERLQREMRMADDTIKAESDTLKAEVAALEARREASAKVLDDKLQKEIMHVHALLMAELLNYKADIEELWVRGTATEASLMETKSRHDERIKELKESLDALEKSKP